MPPAPLPALPPARASGRYRMAFVCSGNICRSPSADVVMAAVAEREGLALEVASSGLGDWHVGDPMDQRSAAELASRGYDPSRHRATQVGLNWFEEYDVLLAMDSTHVEALSSLGDPTRVRLFREWDPVDPGAEVPDPYYGGRDSFREVLDMIERTCTALVPAVRVAAAER